MARAGTWDARRCCVLSRFVVTVLLLLLTAPARAATQDSVFYLGGNGSRKLLGVTALSDSTVLAYGSAENLSWVPAGTPVTVLSATAGNGATLDNATAPAAAPRLAFLAHLSADLRTVLRVVHFPAGAANEIRFVRTNASPFGAPTGQLFLSGSRGDAANATNAGYFLARLNANFVTAPPTALDWVVNVSARGNSEYFELQPWDVQPDGKVLFAWGKPYDSAWCEVTRLKAFPTSGDAGSAENHDVVPGFRVHSLSDGTKHYGLLSAYGGTATATASFLILKVGGTTDAGLLRSFNAEDYLAWARDENGFWRRGRYPMDAFWNNFWRWPSAGVNNTGGGDARGYDGAWYAVPTGSNWTSRVGAIVVDRRNGHFTLGVSHQSILPGGNPDFEPFVVSFAADGAMKWWTRLYKEYDDNGPTAPTAVDPAKVRVSSPDQYVDALAIDYTTQLAADGSGGVVYVGARTHGNNTVNFWNGNQIAANAGGSSYQNGFTGTAGNIHISWIGKLRDDSARATILAASFVAEFAEGATNFAAASADPNLDLWPSKNGGNADLNTTRMRLLWVHPESGVTALVHAGRRTATTRNAYQRNLRPRIAAAVTTAESAQAFRSSTLIGAKLLLSANCKLTLGGQTRTVTAFDDLTGRVVLDTALPSAPVAGAAFTINEGTGSFNGFARTFTPGLESLRYSSLFTGAVNPVDGSGSSNTDLRGLFPIPGGLLVCGTHNVATGTTTPAGNPLPTQNVPSWGSAVPVNEAGFLARVFFASSGYDAWAAGYPALPANARGPIDDPDQDGLLNYLEYALGTDPRAAGGPTVTAERHPTTGLLALTFPRRALPDVRYQVESSTDLISWVPIWSSEGAANVAGSVTVTDTATGSRRFLRLRALVR